LNNWAILSHASRGISRDQRYAYVFGRDGGLTKIDMLNDAISKRIIQAGNSIGGAISQDGRLIAVSNYTPGGVKVFSAETLELIADIPAEYDDGKLSKVVGLVTRPGSASSSACLMPVKSGCWISKIRSNRPSRNSKISANSLTTL